MKQSLNNELVQKLELSESISDLNRKNIPERITHSKGTGAFGIFTLTKNLKEFTSSKFFTNLNQSTKVIARFSNYKTEKGSPDTIRDLKGFAVKFYTEEGNWDFTGNHFPVFFINDPIHFLDLANSHKKDLKTNFYSEESLWDFYSSHEESLHLVLMLYSERGIPKSFRFMDGFSTNSFSFINSLEETYCVKFHFKSEQGILSLDESEAVKLCGTEPDYYSKDLFKAIEIKNFPKWKLMIQIIPKKDLAKLKFNPFDPTKVWSKKLFPEIEIGELVLNQNITNHFEEIESIAFSPKNILPGMDFSPDKLLRARLFAYSDAQRYRLGKDFKSIQVNKPIFEITKEDFTHTDLPISTSYEKNSFLEDELSDVKNFYKMLLPNKKEILHSNLVRSLKNVSKLIQYKQIILFYKVDKEFGSIISSELGIDLNEIKQIKNFTKLELEFYLSKKNESLEKVSIN